MCKNETFWREYDPNTYKNDGTIYGIRCRGRAQHQYFAWYYNSNGEVQSISKTTCEDKSHRVHLANSTCPTQETYSQIYA